jgi:DNA polymerase-3 subunit alpha
LDGLPKIDELVMAAKKYQMPALALTDHGVMYGIIEFYKKCKTEGIKPILGVEAYLALNEMEEKRGRIDDDYHHLTLLAENLEGYKNLLKLTTLAHLEGFYYKPRIDKKTLRKYHQGLIALSGCLRGEIPSLLVAGQYQKAKETLYEYQDIFGKENFFLELQYHPELPDQIKANQELIRLAKETGTPVVATTDSHYLEPTDNEIQDILVCVQTGKIRSETNRLDMRKMELSFKPPEVMIEAFKEIPAAIENTLHIAERCNVELTLGKWVFPKFEPPNGLTPDEYLRELAEKGLKEKFSSGDKKAEERMNYELEIIKQKGFAPYFLVVADYVNWARSQGIIATTRGSAAGSLVSYLIGITTVDPLKFELPFERFLNPYRPLPPDIDIDFADNRRDEVLDYVRKKYGEDKVAQIVTFGTLLPRAAVRDVVRVLGLPYSFGDKIAKMILPGPHGMVMTIDKALEINPELAELYQNNPQVKEVLDYVKRIEGCVRHASVHAAGVVIAPEPLVEYTPLQHEPNGTKIITQYDMHAIEEVGLLKMDFLGIRNLSILGDAVRLVEKTKGIKIDLNHLPFDDKATYDLLGRGETVGVFQLSGSGMTRYLIELKPNSIYDIMAMVALFRPGPMESIPEYIRRKHNPKLVKYLDPRLKKILERTYGIIVYQDDVLFIAVELAGYTWEEADKLRKAIGKKIPQELIAQKEKFLNGCVKNGMLKEKAEELWKAIEPFAAYGFNKAHAASYAVVAYQTAYMKAHFPAEFMTAVLTAESGDNEKVAEIINACREMGIEVLPPNVNESLADFTYINDRQIRFGLLAIKNLGLDVVEAIIEERKKNGLFRSLEDFLCRVRHKNLNKKSLEALIKSGAMDIFGERGMLLENLERILAYQHNLKEDETKQQASLFSLLSSDDSRRPPLNLVSKPPVDSETKLQWEKEFLGLFVSAHPFEKFLPLVETDKEIIPCSALSEENNGKRQKIAGIVTTCRRFLTKNGETMVILQLTDLTGSCEVVVFPKVYKATPNLWQENIALCVYGRGEVEEGKKRLICEKVELLSEFQSKNNLGKLASNNKRLIISLAKATPELLLELKSCLLAHQGDLPVYLEIKNQEARKLIQTEYKVLNDPSVIKLLEEIVGEGMVKLEEGM